MLSLEFYPISFYFLMVYQKITFLINNLLIVYQNLFKSKSGPTLFITSTLFTLVSFIVRRICKACSTIGLTSNCSKILSVSNLNSKYLISFATSLFLFLLLTEPDLILPPYVQYFSTFEINTSDSIIGK